MLEPRRMNTILIILAALILITSFTAFAYSLVPKGDAGVVVVEGVEYGWDSVFEDFEIVQFTASDEEYQGIRLDELVLDAGVEQPETQNYRLTGLDGYQKDVTWEDLQNGYLIEEEHKCVFPHLTRSFWVRDMASIEVV